MHLRQLYEHERPLWSRLSLLLWVVVAYIVLLYLAFRLGGHELHNVRGGDGLHNVLPSAD